MTDENNSDRETFEGDWTCSDCGAKITQLPFEPDPERIDQLLCKDCHKKKMDSRRDDGRERRTFEGDWECTQCGAKITQLPFNPTRTDNLLCKECHQKRNS